MKFYLFGPHDCEDTTYAEFLMQLGDFSFETTRPHSATWPSLQAQLAAEHGITQEEVKSPFIYNTCGRHFSGLTSLQSYFSRFPGAVPAPAPAAVTAGLSDLKNTPKPGEKEERDARAAYAALVAAQVGRSAELVSYYTNYAATARSAAAAAHAAAVQTTLFVNFRPRESDIEAAETYVHELEHLSRAAARAGPLGATALGRLSSRARKLAAAATAVPAEVISSLVAVYDSVPASFGAHHLVDVVAESTAVLTKNRREPPNIEYDNVDNEIVKELANLITQLSSARSLPAPLAALQLPLPAPAPHPFAPSPPTPPPQQKDDEQGENEGEDQEAPYEEPEPAPEPEPEASAPEVSPTSSSEGMALALIPASDSPAEPDTAACPAATAAAEVAQAFGWYLAAPKLAYVMREQLLAAAGALEEEAKVADENVQKIRNAEEKLLQECDRVEKCI